MNDLTDMLAAGLGVPGVQLRDAVVTAVGDSGVNLTMGGVLVDGVPCLVQYDDRAVGDVVAVLSSPKRTIVIGRIGAQTVVPDAPPPVGVPAPVTISPTQDGAWRDGSRESGEDPIQGAWPTYPHPYSGAWFYGTAIAAACFGHTVSSMTLKITRQGKSSGGVYGGADMRLFTHNYTTRPGGPPTLANQWNAGQLEPSESKTLEVPASWRAALAAGSQRGVGCSAGTGESTYIKYAASSGNIHIVFS